jgi:Skp family chaperone for outer membrane proteins
VIASQVKRATANKPPVTAGSVSVLRQPPTRILLKRFNPLALLFLTSFIIFTVPCFAEEILIVDFERVVRESLAAKEVAAQIEKKRVEYVVDDSSKREALERVKSEALGKIQEASLWAVADIAKARRAVLVLQTSQCIVWPRSADITTQVLASVDERLPHLAVNFAPR